MPSQLHETLLLLFNNRPALAPELLRDALRMELPDYSDVRIASADLTDVQPTEYRADRVVLLSRDEPVLGIVVEVQLSRDERKRFVWPVYVTSLRARLECPVCLLVVAGDESVARWAAGPIDVGGGNRFSPWVLGPAGVPEVIDIEQAQADPELAVLSAIAHGQDTDSSKSAQIAFAARTASLGLDAERSTLYFDLVMVSLSEAARKELQAMNPRKYEYQSDFAKRYVAQGRDEGRLEGETIGRTRLLIRLLTIRFGSLSGDDQTRIARATIEELDEIGERLMTARTLQEALGSH